MGTRNKVSHADEGRRRALGWLGVAGSGGLTSLVALGGCASAPKPGPLSADPIASGSPQPAPPPAPPAPPPKRPPRVGLALGGGASRGFAHIGVLQVLEEQGLAPDLVVGTSAGSLVAALYAAGRNGLELATLAEQMDETAFVDWAYPTRGLIRGEALARYVRDKTGHRTIEQLKLPLGIAATDLDSGQGILFRRGDIGTAVRASSAVPAVFQPVKIGQREYVDGGLSAPVPVRHARDMGAEVVVAVDISAATEGRATGDAARMLMQTFAIMGRSIKVYELREADVVVAPRLAGLAGTDFSSRKLSIRAGREAMLEKMVELRQKIAARMSA